MTTTICCALALRSRPPAASGWCHHGRRRWSDTCSTRRYSSNKAPDGSLMFISSAVQARQLLSPTRRKPFHGGSMAASLPPTVGSIGCLAFADGRVLPSGLCLFSYQGVIELILLSVAMEYPRIFHAINILL